MNKKNRMNNNKKNQNELKKDAYTTESRNEIYKKQKQKN